jgi:hypothetical protein
MDGGSDRAACAITIDSIVSVYLAHVKDALTTDYDHVIRKNMMFNT